MNTYKYQLQHGSSTPQTVKITIPEYVIQDKVFSPGDGAENFNDIYIPERTVDATIDVGGYVSEHFYAAATPAEAETYAKMHATTIGATVVAGSVGAI